jgi:hypothetical protein
MNDFNPFAPRAGVPIGEEHESVAAIRARETRAAFATDQARAWLLNRYREEMAKPSFIPGMTFDQAAYQEGAKKVWRDLVAAVFPQSPPET